MATHDFNPSSLSFFFLAKLEFVLTVLEPEAENDPPDQLFFLSPVVIRRENIQVNIRPLSKFQFAVQRSVADGSDGVCVCRLQLERETAALPETKSVTEAPKPDLPSLSDLG